MLLANVGDTSTNGSPVMTLAVAPSATVTVTNNAASSGTVSYWYSLDQASASGTIAPGANNAFTTPAFLTCVSGIAAVQVSGTGY